VQRRFWILLVLLVLPRGGLAIELPVVGIDVVEVSPPYDSAEITAFLANRVVLEMLAGILFRRQGGTWDSIPSTLLEGRS